MGIPMPRFAEKDVKVYLGIRLLTIITFVSMLAVICGQATEGYHTFRPETPVQLAG